MGTGGGLVCFRFRPPLVACRDRDRERDRVDVDEDRRFRFTGVRNPFSEVR
jgi:hypothetical protein